MEDITNRNKEKFAELLSTSFSSKEEVIREYKKTCDSRDLAKDFCVFLSTQLEHAVCEESVEDLQKCSRMINAIVEAEDRDSLKTYFNDDANPLRNTNLIILACQRNKIKVLEYLFDSRCSLLNDLCGNSGLLPQHSDSTCHNSFYYAIRSGNVKLLEKLINDWPGGYFSSHSSELDEMLSRACEDLKLRNVPLSDEMDFFIEQKLISLRFFSNASLQDKAPKVRNKNISERIDLVLQNINLLIRDYSIANIVDERFLYLSKFVAQNIYILKRQLRSTYDKIPWEEIEFCLVIFISSCMKRQESDLFYSTGLNKIKMLNHLANFAVILKDEQDRIMESNVDSLSVLPKSNRDDAVADITNSHPEQAELYLDYQQIRDVYSLEKISKYLKLALSADPTKKEGKFIITRVLQVIGEYVKNTLESPKLSNATSELLLLSLHKSTRQIVVDLRDSLSHAQSLSRRMAIEVDSDGDSFIGVQIDAKKIDHVVSDIIARFKIKWIRALLENITNNEVVDDVTVRKLSAVISKIELDETIADGFALLGHKELEEHIATLKDCIPSQMSFERGIFDQIDSTMNSLKNMPENARSEFVQAFMRLKCICSIFLVMNGDKDSLKEVKYLANKILKLMAPRLENGSLKKIVELSKKLFQSFNSAPCDEIFERINEAVCGIFHIAEIETGDLKWIEEQRNNLNESGSFIRPTSQKKKFDNLSEAKYNEHLKMKLSELGSIFKSKALSKNLIGSAPFYRKDKRLQAVIEVLVLDIMSIFGRTEKHLEKNLLFLDDNIPLLTGECLRNHLEHDETLVDVLLSDPSVAVVLNAEKLISENVVNSKKKIGKVVKDDPSKLKGKFEQNLLLISNQAKMFDALKAGDANEFKVCFESGADIYARDLNLSTALHFAAQGGRVDLIKYFVEQNIDVNVKNGNGQTPLHIAARHWKLDALEFFLSRSSVNINGKDNLGKTALHIAAENGDCDIVKSLLRKNANILLKDKINYSPVHYAVKNNHVEAVKTLMRIRDSVELQTYGELPLLHLAAECGGLELVDYFLQTGADVNEKNGKGETPLQSAALKGHFEVVYCLVCNDADVNNSDARDCTPLHSAVDGGNLEIVNTILAYGPNVDSVDNINNNTPLQHAAKDGHFEIVKTLLQHKANPNIATTEGEYPLHSAAKYGHYSVVAELIKYGADIHAKDSQNATALHHAVASGHKVVAELLISNSRDEINNKTRPHDLTPLHVACYNGNADFIDLLLRNEAEVNSRDNTGSTPIHVAASHCNLDGVDLLITNGAEFDAGNSAGLTPLHIAAQKGNEAVLNFLIQLGVNVNARTPEGVTPLHAAVIGRHVNIVTILIQNGSDLNAIGIGDATPLFLAAEAGLKEIAEVLVANGADTSFKAHKISPLLAAIRFNHKDLVEVLGDEESIDDDQGLALFAAVITGNRYAVDVLLRKKASVNIMREENLTALHVAAGRENKDIVAALLKSGAYIDAKDTMGETPLFVAAQNGHGDIAQMLISNGATVNTTDNDGRSPLHRAAAFGSFDVVQVLLNNGATIGRKDKAGKAPLEYAVSNGHLDVVKAFLTCRNINLNAKCNDDYTVLHIASLERKIEMVKFLVQKGCDINARNKSGAKPIHIAAREGFKEAVQFFLSKGMSVQELGQDDQTVLHYAAMKNRVEVAEYLLEQGADVNAEDFFKNTPIFIATYIGNKEVIEVLLRHGAIYNSVSGSGKKPIEIVRREEVRSLLHATDKLFESVRHNKPVDVDRYIQAGGSVHARSSKSGTALHLAAWKGFPEVVNILLKYGADPNATGTKECTPLHYAAKYSHLGIAKCLLSNGAKFDAVSEGGKSVMDLAQDSKIIFLLKLIDGVFKKVQNNNVSVIDEINMIKEMETGKAVMCARNRDNETLILCAIRMKFSNIDALKSVLQSNVSERIAAASSHFDRGEIQQALDIFEQVLQERQKVLGPDDPGTMEIETFIAKAMFKQGHYQDALDRLETICEKQTKILGADHEFTLDTRSMIALVLESQGKLEMSHDIYQEVYEKQKEVLGLNHTVIAQTQLNMALVLDKLGKYDEALELCKSAYNLWKAGGKPVEIAAAKAQNNIAFVLSHQGKYEEALEMYNEAYEKKKALLGCNHADTLKTLKNMAQILSKQNKHEEALQCLTDVEGLQKTLLPPNHADVLDTQFHMANVLFEQGKLNSALEIYQDLYVRFESAVGASDPHVLSIAKKIEAIKSVFKIESEPIILDELLNKMQL